MAKEPQTGWWIADIANLISISCAVIAQICILFVNHHQTDLTATNTALISQIALGLGFLALAWIVAGLAFAITYRRSNRTANEAIPYVVLLVLAIAGALTVLTGVPG